MMRQLAAMYGDFRSPMRANFQKVPETPTLLRSIMLGNSERRYAQVQIINRRTVSKLWKLNNADILTK